MVWPLITFHFICLSRVPSFSLLFRELERISEYRKKESV